jgi:hypothetical protein
MDLQLQTGRGGRICVNRLHLPVEMFYQLIKISHSSAGYLSSVTVITGVTRQLESYSLVSYRRTSCVK